MTRMDLHRLLCSLNESGSVYFQPPESIKLKYPAIIYEVSRLPNRFADDTVYKTNSVFKIMVIDKDPESKIVEAIRSLPKASFVTYYTRDNLNHTVFTIYI